MYVNISGILFLLHHTHKRKGYYLTSLILAQRRIQLLDYLQLLRGSDVMRNYHLVKNISYCSLGF